jgi:hypothetical protein
MKRVLLALALVGMTAGAAMAQGVGDGVFILHHPPGLVYTTDILDYCPLAGLSDCAGQNPQVPDDAHAVWYIISNFWQTQSFNAVEYGIHFTGQYAPQHAGVCAPAPFLTIEYPAAGSWPADGSAIAIALSAAPDWSGTFVPTGWISGYHYAGYTAGLVELVPSPSTGFIGWLSGGNMYHPAEVGALGVGMPGIPVCSEPPEMWACCLPNYGPCVEVTSEECTAQGGVWHEGVLCAARPCPEPPPEAACCLPDYGPCVFVTEAACLAQGGEWHDGFTCANYDCPTPPPEYACCLPDYAGCVDLASQAECDALGGLYIPFQFCINEPCPTPPVWACCLADFTCQDLTADACAAAGGTWMQDVLCAADPCPHPPTAACCTDCGNTCTELTEAGCAEIGGIWMPDFPSCTPNPCVVTPAAPDSWGSIKGIYR